MRHTNQTRNTRQTKAKSHKRKTQKRRNKSAGSMWPRPPRATSNRRSLVLPRAPQFAPVPPSGPPFSAVPRSPCLAARRHRPAEGADTGAAPFRRPVSPVPEPRPFSVPPLSRSPRSAPIRAGTRLRPLGTCTQTCARGPRPPCRRLDTIASVSVLPLVFTSGWASGVNAYAVVVLLGVFGATGLSDDVPGTLQRPEVLVVAGLLFLCEAVADKIPYVDSAWDAAHTVIRPVAGAWVGALLAGQSGSLSDVAAGLIGGSTALASHTVKAGTRMAVNASPEPFSNIVVSLAEDLGVGALVTFAMFHPEAAAVIAGVVLLAGLVVLCFLVSRSGGSCAAEPGGVRSDGSRRGPGDRPPEPGNTAGHGPAAGLSVAADRVAVMARIAVIGAGTGAMAAAARLAVTATGWRCTSVRRRTAEQCAPRARRLLLRHGPGAPPPPRSTATCSSKPARSRWQYGRARRDRPRVQAVRQGVALQEGGETGVPQFPGADLREGRGPAGAQQTLVGNRPDGSRSASTNKFGHSGSSRRGRRVRSRPPGPGQSRPSAARRPTRAPRPGRRGRPRVRRWAPTAGVPSAKTCRADGSTWVRRRPRAAPPGFDEQVAVDRGEGEEPGPVSKEKPSRSWRRTAPPYVSVRWYTAARWPATASRAAARPIAPSRRRSPVP
ncbi:hypothetical protein SALBM311S_02238 [Streptomyces alboniger]